MSGIKDIAKGGWHPKSKSGGKESWRGDFKGINQVAGWMGKGKDPDAKAREHQATPISSLKDPDCFGPPPKRHVGASGSTGPSTVGSSSSAGLGSALSPEEIRRQEHARQEAAEELQKPAPPPVPYRADTTGLSTANLPKPPVRRPDGLLPVPTSATTPKPKPKLPPRLPPRATASPAAVPDSPPPSYSDTTQRRSDSMLNQGALDRLGKAGISVPGFGIGKAASPPPAPPRAESSSSPQPPEPSGERTNQLGELQSRFSKMRTGSADTTGSSASQGTTWEQKRAALKTASDFQKNPGSVKFSDMRNAASTANNFRERHGEQVAAGWKTASSVNEKYGIADKARSFAGEEGQRSDARTEPVAPASPSGLAPSAKRAPPPPPARKKDLNGGAVEPPPVPLGSKPRPT